jgi:nucleoside-diphosphate kinase
MERTLVIVKPDGMSRGLVGEIISRFENRGFRIIALKMISVSLDMAEKHYEAHKGKAFYPDLLKFMTSGSVVAMVLESEDAITLVRQMMGALNPLDAIPGTIRGDLTTDTRRNLVHGADSPEAAQREIALWFPELM